MSGGLYGPGPGGGGDFGGGLYRGGAGLAGPEVGLRVGLGGVGVRLGAGLGGRGVGLGGGGTVGRGGMNELDEAGSGVSAPRKWGAIPEAGHRPDEGQGVDGGGRVGSAGGVGLGRGLAGFVLGSLGRASGVTGGIGLWQAMQVGARAELTVSQALHFHGEPPRATACGPLPVADGPAACGAAGFAGTAGGLVSRRDPWQAVHVSSLSALTVSHSRHCHVLATARRIRSHFREAVRQALLCGV
jgi:hypothetical protein